LSRSLLLNNNHKVERTMPTTTTTIPTLIPTPILNEEEMNYFGR